MYDYRGKVAGMIIAGISLVILLIQKFTDAIVTNKFNADQVYNMILWCFILGLFCVAFSYEKIEDERVKQIRSKAMAAAFMIESGSLLAFGFTMSTAAQKEGALKEVMDATYYVELGRMLMFMPAVAIALHLVMFHVGLYRDQYWDYSDKVSIINNLIKNPLHTLVIALASIAIVIIVSTLFM